MPISRRESIPHQKQQRFAAWLQGLVLLIWALTLSVVSGWAQTSFGSFVGTVHDPAGAVVAGATITAINVGTDGRRSTKTDLNGNYELLNLVPGGYEIRMEAPGFASERITDLQLLTQQKIRVDRNLRVGAASERIDVSAADEAPIVTEDSRIAETKTQKELIDLPVAIASRGAGSTSAFTTLTTQPGVEIDNDNNISVAGLKPAQVSASIDGLSTNSPYDEGPSAELFPSFEGISEIHVNEVNNSAEYGSVADVTTITKSGTNSMHGSVYDYFQNDFFNARDPFSTTKPALHMNDFGASVGGPLVRNRTFFFVDYEGLRRPSETVIVRNVPSLALRSGDLSVYTDPIYNPFTGQPFPNNNIPQNMISPFAQRALQYLFPVQNTGGPNQLVNNFIENFPTPISTNQGDVRLDQSIGSKHSVFGRLTYKRVDQTQAPGQHYGITTPLVGPVPFYYQYFSLGGGWNYIIRPNVINELRAGWSGSPSHYNFNMPAARIADQIGITPFLAQAPPNYDDVPDFDISGFSQSGTLHSYKSRSGVVQALDNLSIVQGNHTFKFGGDYRHHNAFYFSAFGYARLGQYHYDDSVTGNTNPATGNPYIGNPFAAFLLGIPDATEVSSNLRDPVDGYSNVYGVYGQDSWKVTPSLTLNYGLRWEYHPIMQDYGSNMASFWPNIYAVVNGQTVHGEMVVPDQTALSFVNPLVRESIAPTPIVTAAQAGVPKEMRYNPKTDFGPRLGFAWRITKDSKNVLRGGYGVYSETLYSDFLCAGFATEAGYVGFFTNSFATNVTPQLAFPSSTLPNSRPFPAQLALPGVQNFYDATDFNYKDPGVQQWNLTYERDLGFQTGLRLSYDGSHGSNLGAIFDQNQVPANTVGYDQAFKGAPFPAWAGIYTNGSPARSNYEAFTIDLNKRFSHGLQFEASYNHAVNLSNSGGYSPTSFAGEGGNTLTDIYHPNYDYGNVPFTRRHRFLVTFLYNFPTYYGNPVLKNVTSGWELAGVLLFQTGPFLSVQASGADPSGTNFENRVDNGRADVVPGVPKYPAHQSPSLWVNPAAFAIPPDNIGRFGDSQVGSVVGPGTQTVSLSLFKAIPLYRERVQFRLGAAVANLFNHPNYGPPDLLFGQDTFGTISSIQTAEAAGPRAMQFSARITF